MDKSQACSTSVMTAAAAVRAKYRKTTADGQTLRCKLRVANLGVHPKNRGGMYPAGVRCKALCEEVLDVGFLKEEIDQCVVVVEEMPPEPIQSRSHIHMSGSAYNIDACSNDPLLVTCFDELNHDVRHLMLNHNHMVMCMRAFVTGAKWDLQLDANKIPNFKDEEDRLCL